MTKDLICDHILEILLYVASRRSGWIIRFFLDFVDGGLLSHSRMFLNFVSGELGIYMYRDEKKHASRLFH